MVTHTWNARDVESINSSGWVGNEILSLVRQYVNQYVNFVNFGWSSVLLDTVVCYFCSAITQNCSENGHWSAVVSSYDHKIVKLETARKMCALLQTSTVHKR